MERIGPYEPLNELGRGGMGVVLRARCTRTGREVALKLLQAAQDADVARFDREVQALVRLRHPSIVVVLDAGPSKRGPWVAMELIEGESLQARLRRDGPLGPGEATALARKLCDALEHAHGMGVLHRDVKPANVLLATDGRVVLVDFGLARVLGRESRLTLTGEVLGTPCYMAPEQADGQPCGPPTDVYGVGATLYEALTGQPPLRGKSMIELLNKVLTVAPERPELSRPGLPAPLCDLVMRCLEKDAARRPESAAAVAGALGSNAPARARRCVLVPGLALLGVALASAAVVHARGAACALDDATSEATRPDLALLLMRSRAELKQKDLEGALASAEAALRLAPGSAEALCQRANALAALGRHVEALADCARLATHGELGLRLLVDGGVVAEVCGDPALALGFARRAEELDPDHPRNGRTLILSLVATGGPIDDAWVVAARLLEGGRVDPDTAVYCVATLSKVDTSRARPLVGRARDIWPDHGPTVHLLAIVLERCGAREAALTTWSGWLDSSPDDPNARYERGRMRLNLGDLSGAAEDVERAVRLVPDDLESWELLCLIRERARDAPGAEAALTRMIELRPGAAPLHLRRAVLRERLGRASGAVEDLELASGLAPDDGMNWVNLARARCKTREIPEALAAAERGVSLVPERFESFGVRAQILEELGRRAEARRDYARALELADNARTKDELRRALERLVE